MARDEYNPLRSLLSWFGFLFFFLIVAYFGLSVWGLLGNSDQSHLLTISLLPSIAALGGGAWNFARPLLQLVILLVIIDWVFRRMGVQLGVGVRRFDWNVQAIIAIVVIAAFAVAELGGLGGRGLKDLALVVVGFYFGTQRRTFEVDPQTGKIRQIEEHQNPVHGGTEAEQSDKAPTETRTESPS
jgi:hypothetical protein